MMYLPEIDTRQAGALDEYAHLLMHYNARINLLSRGTTLEDVKRHVDHVRCITLRSIPVGAQVVDWGTGGGLPAIPLAILHPGVTITAVDAVGKKTQAVAAMARKLGLPNLRVWNGRAEEYPEPVHYSISRATAPLRVLWQWHGRVATELGTPLEPGCWRPGLVCLKGGDLGEELQEVNEVEADLHLETIPLARLGFEDKYVVSVCKP